MAQRTVFTCDRCKTDFCECETGKAAQTFPANWSWGQESGIQSFILCPDCTTGLGVFLGKLPAKAALALKQCEGVGLTIILSSFERIS